MILTQEEILQTIQDYFKNKPVRKVWLFGSYARGDADEDSDVDVLVDIEKGAKVGMQYFLWNEELGNLFSKKVDIVSYGWENRHIKPFIDNDKKIIYER